MHASHVWRNDRVIPTIILYCELPFTTVKEPFEQDICFYIPTTYNVHFKGMHIILQFNTQTTKYKLHY